LKLDPPFAADVHQSSTCGTRQTVDGSDYENVAAKLVQRQSAVDHLDDDLGPGIYALIVRPGIRLPHVPVGTDRILYIGNAARADSIRLHFNDADGTRSCPRRSLGALLRHELRLQARPGAGDFRFNTEGEARLTYWLRTHLCVAHMEWPRPREELLAEIDPPLNLGGALSPFRRLLLELRSECRREAHSWVMERQ
jgi:GIY-YIG catalytic domain-containing protein